MLRVLPSVLCLFTCLFFGCESSLNKPIRTTTVEEWKPDSGLEAELEPRVELGQFSVKPPKGFERLKPRFSNLSEDSQPMMWSRSSGFARLVIEKHKVGKDQQAPSPPAAALQLVKSLKREFDDWNESPPKPGTIAGTTFSKKEWSGTLRANGIGVAGVSYVCVLDDVIVDLTIYEKAPVGEGLKLGQNAIFTFEAN